jgi:hypothetical protein
MSGIARRQAWGSRKECNLKQKESVMNISFLAVLTTLFALGTGQVTNPGSCGSLDRSACVKAAGCRWIKDHEGPEGRKLVAHCRSLPALGAKKEVPPPDMREKG